MADLLVSCYLELLDDSKYYDICFELYSHECVVSAVCYVGILVTDVSLGPLLPAGDAWARVFNMSVIDVIVSLLCGVYGQSSHGLHL